MKKNMILLALVFALSAASLTACGTMDNGGTNGGNTNPQTQQGTQDKTPQTDMDTDLAEDKDLPDGAEKHDNTLTEEAKKMMP